MTDASSMARHAPPTGHAPVFGYINGFVLFLFEDVFPHLGIGRELGAQDLLSMYPDDKAGLFALWQVEALLQHYGWPTEFVDLTFDPRTALFFASFDFAADEFLSDRSGVVYGWDISALGSDPFFAYHSAVIADVVYEFARDDSTDVCQPVSYYHPEDKVRDLLLDLQQFNLDRLDGLARSSPGQDVDERAATGRSLHDRLVNER